MSKDWTGNKKSTFATLGASSHSEGEREVNDYYATDPRAIDALLSVMRIRTNVWECACGEGHLSKRLVEKGFNVKSTDLIDRGYGQGGVDFLNQTKKFDGTIITNPPYKYGKEFVLKALELSNPGNMVCMFLKLTFLEGQDRYENLFKTFPPRVVWVFSNRIKCAINGDFEGSGESAAAYAWFCWEKDWYGDTRVAWVTYEK